MARVLVTGGAGYIGSHTSKALARAGFEPVVLDNLATGHRRSVRWGPLVEGDLADVPLVRKALHDHDVAAVVHFAASAYVGDSMRDPRAYFRNNVANTLHLLDAMLDEGVRDIVFSSTCATYGPPEAVPIPEEHPQRPANPYGESKLFVERMLRWYGHAYGLRWLALRYFNAAGADAEGELGEVHDPETHLIPLAIQASLGQLPHLQIFGTDYPTPDGTAVRDYVHVADLASAHVRALEYLRAGGEPVALNLGTGQGHSVRQVIAEVEAVSGRAIPVCAGPRRPGDVAILVADAQRASRELGWLPDTSTLGAIVASAWLWHADRSDGDPARG